MRHIVFDADEEDENDIDGNAALKKALSLVGGGSQFANAEDFAHLIDEDDDAIEYGSDEDFDESGLDEFKKAVRFLITEAFRNILKDTLTHL